MIEELQRSVIFFSRANGTLKQQNDELTRLLMQAQTQVAAIESGGEVPDAPAGDKKEAAVTAAAVQPTSAAAAAMAGVLPPMQPGATMQAMANFQQAAAAAMQVAVQGMKGIPGVDVQNLTSAADGNSQQAYNDTMTALAMQKAAAAVAATPQGGVSAPVMAAPTLDTKEEAAV